MRSLLSLGADNPVVVTMEGNSGDSGSDYFDCVTDRSGSSSEETEFQVAANETPAYGDPKGKSGREEVQRTPTIRRFRRVDDSSRRQNEIAKTEIPSAAGGGSEAKQAGDGFEIRGYELRAPPRSTHALKRLGMDAGVYRREEENSPSMRSKVQEEVMKVLFGPPDAKTPDEEKYELVEQEVVRRGLGRTGILFRFSMWATLGFVAWVLGGRRAKVGCSEIFPNVRERDPVPKVIVRKQT